MKLYIPYGSTPYEGESHYGVFSSIGKARQRLLDVQKPEYYQKGHFKHELYDIYILYI